MIKYFFQQKNPASHYIDIEIHIDQISSETIQLQLPSWRPGRYELGNFAKNIKHVEMFDQNNQNLVFRKLNKDCWEVPTKNCSFLKVTYSYYAAELNAGACFADGSQMYVNPVHCCMYVSSRRDEEHQIQIDVPENYKIVSSLKQEGHTLIAADYEELVDSPFIASTGIQSEIYTENGINFYLHFNGECRPDFVKIKKDFAAFTNKQLMFWQDCPVDEYHFIFQIVPYKFYHGVEHKKSTVITIGPGYAINGGDVYEDVLGVSCHELFHLWNIKTIRPIEMLPYDYKKENYSRSGYVYEGFTTYYGDKILLSSDVFNEQQYFVTLQERLLKHFHNFGRFSLSVTESSWETWLDGYLPGAPYRKTNIYDEGCLIAFMLDVLILRATGNTKSLRDVCLLLYERFGKRQIGYTEQDVIDLVSESCNQEITGFFNDYVYTAADFEKPLISCFDYLGITMLKQNSPFVCEHLFGFKVVDNGNFSKVNLVAPQSPAWKAGLFNGDEIMAVNGVAIKSNFHHWLNYFSNEAEIKLTVNNNEQIKIIMLKPDQNGNTYFFNPILIHREQSSEEANEAYRAWKNL
jgi:predicted metalloprotease with PDZ domain